MQRQVQAKLQNTSTSVTNANDILPKVKDWINTRYARIYRSYYWEESIDSYTHTMTASTSEYAFNRDFEKVYNIFDSKNAKPIILDTIQGHTRYHAPALDKTGNVIEGDPKRCRLVGTFTVKAELSANDTIDVVSSDAADVSTNCVRILGLENSSSSEIGENVTLTGTSAATSTTTFSSGQKLQVSVGTTDGTRRTVAGTITVSETTSGTVLAKISPQEQAHKYFWFKVSPTPPSTGTQATWQITYQKLFRELVNDNDIPLFDCCMEIVQGAYADALRDDGLEEEANLAEQQFTNMVLELQATRKQPMMSDQFRPYGQPITKLDNDAYLWVT